LPRLKKEMLLLSTMVMLLFTKSLLNPSFK
jgi:hypothetical protein